MYKTMSLLKKSKADYLLSLVISGVEIEIFGWLAGFEEHVHMFTLLVRTGIGLAEVFKIEG